METVKVDIQKLQLLNDRIVQTIDALNQLRMSVHGIQHTPAQVSPFGYAAAYGAYPQQLGAFAPQSTPFANPFGFSPFASSPYPSPFSAGIQHTTPYAATPYVTPYGIQNPYAASAFGIQNPYAASAFTIQNPYAATFANPYVNAGISHTAWDPYAQLRAAQTTPWTTQTTPWTGTGISHSTWDPSWQLRWQQVNPLTTNGISQTPWDPTWLRSS